MRSRLLRSGCFAGVLASVVVMSTMASALEFEAGARVGTGWNLLTQPSDRAGSDTLLHGSAFTGFGFLVGPAVATNVAKVAGARFDVTADLLYGFHRGSGFEEYPTGERVDVTLSTHVIRLPLMVQVANEMDRISPAVGLGLEPVFGLMSGATVENTNIDRPAEALETTPKSSVSGIVSLGVNWDQGKFVVPVDLRFSWNPFVGSSTQERFDGYRSRENRGAYEVAFNWQIMMTAGMRWGF